MSTRAGERSPGSDPPEMFLEHAAALEVAIAQLACVTPVTPNAFEYTRVLLAVLIRANGEVSLPEIDLLRRYHLDSFSLSEEIEMVRETVQKNPDFLKRVPTFLAEAAARRSTLPELALAMLRAIRGMCTAIVHVDRVADPTERRVVESYLRLLENAARANAPS